MPRGYAVVIQDVRGRYKSGRTLEAYHRRPRRRRRHRRMDRRAVLVERRRSARLARLRRRDPARARDRRRAVLKTMIPVDAMSNFGSYGVRHNGAFELRFFNWVFTMGNAAGTCQCHGLAAARAASPIRRPLPRSSTWVQMSVSTSASAASARHHAAEVRTRLRGVADRSHEPRRLRRLLEEPRVRRRRPRARVQGHPRLPRHRLVRLVGAPGREFELVELRKAKKSLQRLIIGPWTHGGQSAASRAKVEFTREAALDFNAWRLRWFDRWVKGVDNGVDREAPVRIFVMGGGDGRKTPKDACSTAARGATSRSGRSRARSPRPTTCTPDGTLSPTDRPTRPRRRRYLFDPRTRCRRIGGNVSSRRHADPRRARRTSAAAPDIWLLHRHAGRSPRAATCSSSRRSRWTRDLEVTGELEVKLWAARRRARHRLHRQADRRLSADRDFPRAST